MPTMQTTQRSLDQYFGLTDHGTTVSREALAGLTTFLAMAYITVVNPLILSDAGMDFGAVFVATCCAAAFGSLVMGIMANYPIGMAPGMGQNAFFLYLRGRGRFGSALAGSAGSGFHLWHLVCYHQFAANSGVADQFHPAQPEAWDGCWHRLFLGLHCDEKCRYRRPKSSHLGQLG